MRDKSASFKIDSYFERDGVHVGFGHIGACEHGLEIRNTGGQHDAMTGDRTPLHLQGNVAQLRISPLKRKSYVSIAIGGCNYVINPES